MRRLLQILPTHHSSDAIGAEALVIERLMEGCGWDVQTYAEYVDPELEGSTLGSEELEKTDTADAVALYHLCVCSPLTFLFAELDCPKAVIYHNITPPDYFRPYDSGLAGVSEEAERQLRLLADKVDVGIADSEFNRLELERCGYKATRTIAYLFDPDRYGLKPDKKMLRKLSGPPVVLFVGRLAPNKAPDDLIRVAAAYSGLGLPRARFVIVGKNSGMPAYDRILEELVEREGLGEDRLLLTGEVSQAELIACYRSAGLFLSLSRHEGFMVPLLESMLFEVPILALARAAVPETLGGAGLLFDTAEPEKVAALVGKVLFDEELKRDMIKLGRRRLSGFDHQRWGFVLRKLLEQL